MLFVAPTATRDPDTSKHMCDYRCAFTSTQSNWAGKATSDCGKHTKPWAFVRCDACPDGPVHRCTECYTKYGTTMRRRIPEIEKHQGAKCVTRPELEALLNVNFRQLASGEAAAGHQLLEYVSEVELKGGKRVHVWRWRSRCPCCYDFKVPEIKPAMPADFPRREVDVRDDVTMVVQAPILDNVTGMVQAAHGAVVRIITLAAALSREEERAFGFRAADPPEHDNYLKVWQPPAWPAGSQRTEQRWTLVRSAGSADEEPKALSLIAWRMLDGVAEEHDARTIGMAFLQCTREAGGEGQGQGQG